MPMATTCRSPRSSADPRRRARCCRQAELLGSYRFAQQRPDRPHHRRHERRPEREESVGFSDPYLLDTSACSVEGSPTKTQPASSDFSGATVLGQRTPCSIPSSTILGVVHKNPVDSRPTVFSNLLQGTSDAGDLQYREREGLYGPKSSIVPIHFAEVRVYRGHGNVGCRKGSNKLLKLIDSKTLKGVVKRSATKWDACLDRQPA